MTALKHAEVICHMAQHGLESVEGGRVEFWRDAGPCYNPLTHPEYEWRIKPMLDGFSDWFLAIRNASVFYKHQKDRDEAERIIFNALRGE